MWEQTLAVFIVLGLLVGSLWLLRRKGFASMNLGFGGSARRMELVERLALTPHHSLHLVRVEGQFIVIGVSPQSCTPVHSFSGLTPGTGLSNNTAVSTARERQGS